MAHFLADGKRFTYFAGSHRDPFGEPSEIRVGSLEPGFDDHVIVSSNAEGIVAGDTLLTLSGEDLVAYEFDDKTATVSMPSRALGVKVLFDPTTWKAAFSVRDGMLVYVPAGGGGGFDVIWKYRSGTTSVSGLPTGNYLRVELNQKGSFAVFEVQYDKPNSDMWLTDLETGVRSRMGTGPSDEVSPVFSSDGAFLD